MRTFIFLLLAIVANSYATADSCMARIPKPLNEALTKSFPEYRAPVVTDNLAEDIAWNLKERGNGCLGVAISDFDGDNVNDYLLALTSLKTQGAKVVVAFARQSTWEFHTLHSSSSGRTRLYVAAQEPGLFQRTEALDGALEAGEKASMECHNWGVSFGATESSGVVYCYTKGQWSHVWVSD